MLSKTWPVWNYMYFKNVVSFIGNFQHYSLIYSLYQQHYCISTLNGFALQCFGSNEALFIYCYKLQCLHLSFMGLKAWVQIKKPVMHTGLNFDTGFHVFIKRCRFNIHTYIFFNLSPVVYDFKKLRKRRVLHSKHQEIKELRSTCVIAIITSPN